MKDNALSNIRPLGFNWDTANPFIFCVHHHDFYPKANEDMTPAASLEGRKLGMDFTVKDGWRMYHGSRIPGFPAHPHRGFETITIVLDGFVDHSDSHGQAGRYGMGDVQWMTAGAGLQHSEMFPLLKTDKPNNLELFQIWLNLPRKRKFADPYYKMLWAEDIPVAKSKDKNGKQTEVRIIAGDYNDMNALAPAPDSWAAEPENEVAIWLVKMAPGASWKIPKAAADVIRNIYFYKGSKIQVEGSVLAQNNAAQLNPEAETEIINNEQEGYLLLLQGKPIDEPVVQHGPFVMNTEAEIIQAISDYRETHFGGWPWDREDNVHPRASERFAR